MKTKPITISRVQNGLRVTWPWLYTDGNFRVVRFISSYATVYTQIVVHDHGAGVTIRSKHGRPAVKKFLNPLLPAIESLVILTLEEIELLPF